MNPGARRGEPEQGRGQPFVSPFSGGHVLAVVFNQLRGMEPDPDAGERQRLCRTMTRAGCQCEDMGDGERLPRPAGVIIGSARIDLGEPLQYTAFGPCRRGRGASIPPRLRGREWSAFVCQRAHRPINVAHKTLKYMRNVRLSDISALQNCGLWLYGLLPIPSRPAGCGSPRREWIANRAARC